VKVVVTGAAGQLGRELLRTAPEPVSLVAFSREDLDITRVDAVDSALAEARPDLVINAAAYTAVDRAEEEPDQAFAVNAEGVENIARATSRQRVRLIHISTDFVFDGRSGRPYKPDDKPEPLGVYGASKLAGERRALEAAGNRLLVLRTAWLYSAHGTNFVKTILSVASRGDPLEVVSDQVGTPTWARGLAETVWSAAGRSRLSGIHHWTDAGVASRYDFAVAVLEQAGSLDLIQVQQRIRPVSSAERPTRAPRPACSVLDKHSTWRTLDCRPRHWRENLKRMLTELRDQRDG
jgi:dTDP-4-dehydrorhamnose reductase